MACIFFANPGPKQSRSVAQMASSRIRAYATDSDGGNVRIARLARGDAHISSSNQEIPFLRVFGQVCLVFEKSARQTCRRYPRYVRMRLPYRQLRAKDLPIRCGNQHAIFKDQLKLFSPSTSMYIALVRQEANEASRSPGREAAGQHRVLPALVSQELMRLRRRTLAVALACERELEQGAGVCPLCGNGQ